MTVDRLLSFVDGPVASETAGSMLRRAAVQLEKDIRDESVIVYNIENEESSALQQAIDIVKKLMRQELDSPTQGLVDGLERLQSYRDELAAEPEDAVWIGAVKETVAFGERYHARKKTELKLRDRTATWLKVLSWADKYGVQVCMRQTLITAYFDKVSEDGDDESEGEGEGESEEGMEEGGTLAPSLNSFSG